MVCLDQSQEHLPQQCWPVADAEAGLSCCLLAMLPSAHHPAALLDRTIAWHDQRSHVYTSHHIMHHNWWHHNWYQLDQTCLIQQLASARMNNSRSCNNYRAMRCLVHTVHAVPRYIIHQQSTLSSSIIVGSDGGEALLACSIPYLQLTDRAIHSDHTTVEVDTNGWLIVGKERVLRESS